MSGRHRSPVPIVIQLGAMGDLVMLTAVCEHVSRRWDSKIAVIASGGWAEPIFGAQPWLDDLLVVRGTKGRIWWLSPAKREAVRWLRSRRDAPVYLFEQQPKMRDVLRAAEIPDDRVLDFAHYPRSDGEHQIAHHLRMARHTPPAFTPRPDVDARPLPRLPVDAEGCDEARRWLKHLGAHGPVVLLQPGNKRTMRRGSLQRASNLPKFWPEAAWSRVARGVCDASPDVAVLVCGVEQERPLVQRIVAEAGSDRVFDVAGKLPLSRLFPLLSIAHSMISVDTGPAHAAAALDCPVVVMFGGTDPRHYHPWGRGPVRLITPSSTGDAIETIRWSPEDRLVDVTPERVVEAWMTLGSREPADSASSL